jgi:nitroreductase
LRLHGVLFLLLATQLFTHHVNTQEWNYYYYCYYLGAGIAQSV